MLGTVVFWKNDKGYGFIRPDSGDTEVFVDITAAQHARIDGLKVGQRLGFDIKVDPLNSRRSRAVNLKLALSRKAKTNVQETIGEETRSGTA